MIEDNDTYDDDDEPYVDERGTFTMDIDCGNAAFADPDELPELIQKVARKVRDEVQSARASYSHGKVRDSNGNTVGSWEIS